MRLHKLFPSFWETLLQLMLIGAAAIVKAESSDQENNGMINFASQINSMNTEIKKISEQNKNLLSIIIQQYGDLSNQIKNLQNAVNAQTRNFHETFVQQNTKLEKNIQEAVGEHQSTMENIDNKVDKLTTVLFGHSDLLEDLKHLGTADQRSVSNQTCGGVLIGQSGSIYFSPKALAKMEGNIPSACIWTIRVNNRKNIKIRTYHQNVSILEIVENKNNVYDNSLEPKLTRLNGNPPYIFEGPIVFVVFKIPEGNNFIPLELHFEGKGKLTEKQTFFFHEHLLENSGTFNFNHIDTQADNLIGNNKTYSWEYTSIVISTFSTYSHLKTIFKHGEFCEGNNNISLHVITDILNENKAEIVNCCKHNCMGQNSIFNYGGPYLVLIKKKYQVPLSFNLLWKSEEDYPSNSGQVPGYDYVYKCGGVVGGTNGNISYKPDHEYNNGEKCIWTIIPKSGRSLIEINIISSGVKRGDRFYMMELSDVNGNELSSPKITNLRNGDTQNATTNMLYIVFYTDSSETGEGFELAWRSAGDIIEMRRQPRTDFKVLKSQTGYYVSNMDSILAGQSQVLMITPMVSLSSKYSLMHFEISRGLPNATNYCLYDDISIYTSYGGYLSKESTNEICDGNINIGKLTIESFDGMAMVVISDPSAASSPVSVDISWKLENENYKDPSYITFESYQCGGVITGDKGVLKYKANDYYSDNERCIWLLQTPEHSSLSLSLIQEEFETCCDVILVNTIDPSDGTVVNGTTIINSAKPFAKFSESVLVITFYTDHSIIGRGFTLRFHGSGKVPPSDYRYQLQHIKQTKGEVSYPNSLQWKDPNLGVKDVIVTAYSAGVDSGTSGLPINITWKSGLFRKENESEGICSYESITFYTPSRVDWKSLIGLPEVDTTISCPDKIIVPEIENVFNTSYPAFLSIYRHIPATSKQDGGNIEFSFRKTSTCGEVIIGHSGVISYKEDRNYTNKENCIWLIRAPEAKKINLTLEKSDFEECCDFLHISTIKQGVPTHEFTLRQGNESSTVVVDGPVAVIIFTSDHSVTGTGFRLSYTTAETATSPFLFTYHLKHRHQLGSNQFRFEVMNNNDLYIAAFSIEPSTLTDKSLKSKITVSSLRAQRDGNCNSDTLTVYNVANTAEPIQSYTASSVAKNAGFCTALQNNNYNSCNVITDCNDSPAENTILNLNTISFIAVYKTVDASSVDLKFRGLVLESSTTLVNG